MNKIIAIVGMCGSGKSVACEILENLNYQKVYFGGVTMDILKEKGMPVTPENEKEVRENLRKCYGMAAYAIKLLPKIEKLASENNVVLDGLYSWDELKVISEKFDVITIAIIADKNLRYERLKIRETRSLNELEAKNRDISEIENLAKGGPIAFADYYILNNGTKNDLEERLKEILNNIGDTNEKI